MMQSSGDNYTSYMIKKYVLIVLTNYYVYFECLIKVVYHTLTRIYICYPLLYLQL
jgi:hypothetical protein